MSQAWPTQIDPAVTDGSILADKWNAYDLAAKSGQRGLTRPSGILAGGIWTRDNGDGTDTVMMFDGTQDVPIATQLAATPAEFRAETAGRTLTPTAVWDAAQEVVLADTDPITPDLSAGINFTVTLGGNRTLAAPSNPKSGQTGRLVIDNSGGHTLSFSSVYRGPGLAVPDLGPGVHVLYFDVQSGTSIFISVLEEV